MLIQRHEIFSIVFLSCISQFTMMIMYFFFFFITRRNRILACYLKKKKKLKKLKRQNRVGYLLENLCFVLLPGKRGEQSGFLWQYFF